MLSASFVRYGSIPDYDIVGKSRVIEFIRTQMARTNMHELDACMNFMIYGGAHSFNDIHFWPKIMFCNYFVKKVKPLN